MREPCKLPGFASVYGDLKDLRRAVVDLAHECQPVAIRMPGRRACAILMEGHLPRLFRNVGRNDPDL